MSSSAIIERIRTLLQTVPPFSELSEDDRQDVLADISIEYYRQGEIILEQGSIQHPGLYLVESGLVRLMDVDQQRLVDKCQEGDFFGSFGLLKGGSVIYQAKAIEETVCALIRVRRFHQLYKENEGFAMFFERDIRRYMRYLDSVRDVSGAHQLLNRQLREFGHRAPVTCKASTTAKQAAQLMSEQGVSSILVTKGQEVVGIVTDSDLRSRLIARGRSFETPVRRVMSTPVQMISEASSLFEATMKMLRERVSRLVITHSAGAGEPQPAGVITDRDIAHFRRLDPLATLRRILKAPTVSRLADIHAGLSDLLLRLNHQGVQPEEINQIAAVFHDRVVVRVLELVRVDSPSGAQKLLRELPWAWMRLGSGGRKEAALNSEQHNALVYANPESEEQAREAEAVFNDFAEAVNEQLETCGFTPSQVVARRAAWRKPLREWKKTYRTWIHKADEEALARVPFFFDLRAVYGAEELVEDLKEDLIDALNVQEMDEERRLLPLLARNALANRPPLSFFGRFVLERSGEHRNALNIRDHGIVPVVDAARVLALELRYVASSNTFDRLRHAVNALPELREPLEAVLDAYQYCIDFRLEHQLRAVEMGEQPDNYIEPAILSKLQQNLLRSAFGAVATLQDHLAERYAVKRGWSLPGSG